MKKYLCLILILGFTICARGQFTQNNSIIRKALVTYNLGGDGFYYKSTGEMVDCVNNIVEMYAYDVKAQNLYILTDNRNCIVTLNKDYAKIIKRNKTIPHLKDKEIDAEVLRVNAKLDAKFEQINEKRRQFIVDSIAKAKADSIAKVKADSIAREKAKADSIARAKEDSIRLAKIEQKNEDYRKAHDWHWVPIGNTRLTCTMCDESISYKDSILCMQVKNDTIYHAEFKDLALGYTYLKLHKYPIPISLKNDQKFKYHCDVYSDSLTVGKLDWTEYTEDFNDISFFKALGKVKKEAPYGYFGEWGWDDEYSSLSFHFSYTNTNEKTIKYINVFFAVTNAVGDVRKTGNFKGTGPVEMFDTGSWKWDHSSYYVAGDASDMEITKVIITYMDGTQKTLTKNMIRFD